MEDFSLFPEDLLINILLRLSSKYVFRSRLVCKKWNSLLRSPKFSSLYYNHQLCRQERLANDGVSSFIVLEYVENDSFEENFPSDQYIHDLYEHFFSEDQGLYDVHSQQDRGDYDDEPESYDPGYVLLSFVTQKKIDNELITTVDRVEKFDILFTSLSDRYFAGHTKFSNVYDGVICLENGIGVILYNPYTRETQRLTFRPCTHPNYYHIVLGLWFESNQLTTIKHYKVFSLLALQNVTHDTSLYTYVIEKYDSIESSWMEIMTMPNQKYPFCRDTFLLFNGILHLYVDDYNNNLITLDVRAETFGLLPLPTGNSEQNIKNGSPFMYRSYRKIHNIESCFVPHLFVLGRSFAIFAQNTDNVSCIDIWIMTEYGIKESWTKQYTINPEAYMTVGDFDRLSDFSRKSLTFNIYTYYGCKYPSSFKLWWSLLLNWKCMDDDEMILQLRIRNNDVCDYFVDDRSKLVSFNLFSNELSDINMCVTGNLLSIVPCIETTLSFK